MSHDILSRARAIIAFLGVETGYWSTNQGAGAMACTFIGGRSPAARLSMARLGVYFAPKWLGPFYNLTTDEEANDCVCVLAKARDPCR